MTRDEIERNSVTYKEQVFKILDPNRTEIRFNSQWLAPLTFENLVRLCSKYTVARLLERDDFSKRFKDGAPISVHEFLYPLSQAFDSVALECDVEMGGTDQKFNLLVGREIQKDYGQLPQIVATTPLLEGLTGDEKMSKSKNNYVGIAEPAKVMFAKIMRISDERMFRYYELLTDTPVYEIARMRDNMASGIQDPMEAKLALARQIVADFHSETDAEAAHDAFNREVRQRLEPIDTETVDLPPAAASQKGIRIDKLIAMIGLADSVTDATRKIKSGAVEVNGTVDRELLRPDTPGLLVIRVGKKWKRVRTPAKTTGV
jgi:tyrosyl-tRNA synthetase